MSIPVRYIRPVYAKIFSSIYDGTLGTVGPWEALVTFIQMLVLSDKYGIVDMTPDAISRRTTIPLEIIKRGITALEQPDHHSRRSDFDGRRIVRLDEHRDWGWRIVNHAHYRAIRSAEERREYQRTYKRELRKPMPFPPTGFVDFWTVYPRKVGKGTAEKAWLKISPNQELTSQIIKAVGAQCACDQWLQEGGKFIPHPTTWLNRKSWLDEKTNVNLGRCWYCPEAAIGISNDLGYCARHREEARLGKR